MNNQKRKRIFLEKFPFNLYLSGMDSELFLKETTSLFDKLKTKYKDKE